MQIAGIVILRFSPKWTGMAKLWLRILISIICRLVGDQSAEFIVIQFEFYPGLGRPCTVDLIKIATVFISITNPITKASLVWLNLILLSVTYKSSETCTTIRFGIKKSLTWNCYVMLPQYWALIYTPPWKVYFWNELVSSKLRPFELYLCQRSFWWPDKTANVRFLYVVLDRCTVY